MFRCFNFFIVLLFVGITAVAQSHAEPHPKEITIGLNPGGDPENLKKQVALPNTGNHVLGSPIKSKDIKSVQAECEKFAKEVLQLKEISQ